MLHKNPVLRANKTGISSEEAKPVSVWFRGYDSLAAGGRVSFGPDSLDRTKLGLDPYKNIIQIDFIVRPNDCEVGIRLRWNTAEADIWNMTDHTVQLNPQDHKKLYNYICPGFGKRTPEMPMAILKDICASVLQAEQTVKNEITTLLRNNGFFNSSEKPEEIGKLIGDYVTFPRP